jgi:hypothetical protein
MDRYVFEPWNLPVYILGVAIFDTIQVQTWDSNEDPRDTAGWQNKHWLIAQIPGSEDYQIINEHYGVLAGCFAGERNGNWLVKAAPISTHGWAARWKIVDAGNG